MNKILISIILSLLIFCQDIIVIRRPITSGGGASAASVTFDDNADYLDLTSGMPDTTNFTISGWARASAITVHNNVFNVGDFGGLEAASFYVNSNNTDADIRLFSPAIGNSGELLISLDTWYFFAVVKTGTSLQFYHAVDSDSALTTGGTVSPVTLTAPSVLMIGQDHWGGDDSWRGQITSIKMWTVALSKAELEADWKSLNVVSQSGNIYANIKMQSAATAGNDSSGNSHTFTIHGTLADSALAPTGLN